MQPPRRYLSTCCPHFVDNIYDNTSLSSPFSLIFLGDRTGLTEKCSSPGLRGSRLAQSDYENRDDQDENANTHYAQRLAAALVPLSSDDTPQIGDDDHRRHQDRPPDRRTKGSQVVCPGAVERHACDPENSHRGTEKVIVTGRSKEFLRAFMANQQVRAETRVT